MTRSVKHSAAEVHALPLHGKALGLLYGVLLVQRGAPVQSSPHSLHTPLLAAL